MRQTPRDAKVYDDEDDDEMTGKDQSINQSITKLLEWPGASNPPPPIHGRYPRHLTR